jgi:hypothetical protein
MEGSHSIPQPESASTLHVSVQDRLRSLRDVAPPEVHDQLDAVDAQGKAHEIDPTGDTFDPTPISTVEEYMGVELDSRLELVSLARQYQAHIHGGHLGRDSLRREQVAQRPDWQAHFPKDGSAEEAAKWSEFVSQYPPIMQSSLRALLLNQKRLEGASHDPELMAQVEQEKQQDFEAKQAAILLGALKRKQERLENVNRSVRWTVASQEQPLTLAQKAEIKGRTDQIKHLQELEKMALVGLDEQQLEAAVVHGLRLDLLRDRAAIRSGLLETSHMKGIMDRQLANLMSGGTMLLVGETGGAKTALAEHMAMETQRLLGRGDKAGYEFVSGYGEITAYQLIGKQELVKKDDATVTEFALGAISRAMVNGQPLIIDEINAMPPEIIKRLNKILLLKPGDTYSLQENGGQTITVGEGFCIIATANEKSRRYKGVQELSVEARNRFAATTERVKYPDSDVLPGEVPPEMYRVALAFLTDSHGNIPFEQYGLDIEEFVSLLKAAHITQRLFSEPATSTVARFVDDSAIRDGKTGLETEVISPRMVIAMLELLVKSGGQVALKDILRSYVDGIKENTSDRQVIEKVLRDQNLLED